MTGRGLPTSLAGGLVAAALLVGIIVAPPATATEPLRRAPAPVATVTGPESPRLDQDTTQAAVVTGASRAAAITVTWGDGASERRTPTCSVQRAVKRPASCRLQLNHRYTVAGTFPIVVSAGARVIARATVTVRDAPHPWAPPPGWVQPAGWLPFDGGATYVPCSTVTWTYSRSGEPADAVGMRSDIEQALARLAQETGLTFTETAEPKKALLTYSWGDLGAENAEAAGLGGRKAGRGFVTFSTTHWWPRDDWAGFAIVTQADGTTAAGRGWLVMHETMHALGLDHVDDPTQVMSPVASQTTDLGAGDRDGLRTMYLNNPCPA